MFFAALLSLVAFAAANNAPITKEQEGHGHGCHRHHHHHHHSHGNDHHCPPSNAVLNTGTKQAISCDSAYESYKAVVDAGTYKFTFTKPYTWAFQSFLYEAATQTQVLIWDCFCGGDGFVVFNNGEKIFETAGGEEDTECNEFSEFANQCLFGSGEEEPFAFGIGLLPPGKQNITIGIKSSPYKSGTGFISFVSACGVNIPEPEKSNINKKLKVKDDILEFIPCCALLADCNWSTILTPEPYKPCHKPEHEGCHRHPRAAIPEQKRK